MSQSMPIRAGGSGVVVNPMVSNWESTQYFGRQKLEVEISEKGEVLVNRIAQNSFQYLGSIIVEFFSLGSVKDCFKDQKVVSNFTARQWKQMSWSAHRLVAADLQLILNRNESLAAKIEALGPDKILNIVSNVSYKDDVDLYVQEVRQVRDPLVQQAEKARNKFEQDFVAIAADASPIMTRLITKVKSRWMGNWKAFSEKLKTCQTEEFNALRMKMSSMEAFNSKILEFLKTHRWANLENCLYDALRLMQQTYDKLPIQKKIPADRWTLAQMKSEGERLFQLMLSSAVPGKKEQLYSDFASIYFLNEALFEEVRDDLSRNREILLEMGFSSFEVDPSSKPIYAKNYLANQIFENLNQHEASSNLTSGLKRLSLADLAKRSGQWDNAYSQAIKLRDEILQMSPQLDEYMSVFADSLEEAKESASFGVESPYLPKKELLDLDPRNITDIATFRKRCVEERSAQLQKLVQARDQAEKWNELYAGFVHEIQTFDSRLRAERAVYENLRQIISGGFSTFEEDIPPERFDEIFVNVSKFTNFQTIAEWLEIPVKPLSKLTIEEMQKYRAILSRELAEQAKKLQGISSDMVRAVSNSNREFSETDPNGIKQQAHQLIDVTVAEFQAYQRIVDQAGGDSNKIVGFIQDAQHLKQFASIFESPERAKKVAELSSGRDVKKYFNDVYALLQDRKNQCYQILIHLYPKGSKEYQEILKKLVEEHQKAIEFTKRNLTVRVPNFAPDYADAVKTIFALKIDQIAPYAETFEVVQEDGKRIKKPLADLSPEEFLGYSQQVQEALNGVKLLEAFAPIHEANFVQARLNPIGDEILAAQEQLEEQDNFVLAAELAHLYQDVTSYMFYSDARDIYDKKSGIDEYIEKIKAAVTKIKVDSNDPIPSIDVQIKEFETSAEIQPYILRYPNLIHYMFQTSQERMVETYQSLDNQFRLNQTALESNPQYSEEQRTILSQRLAEIYDMKKRAWNLNGEFQTYFKFGMEVALYMAQGVNAMRGGNPKGISGQLFDYHKFVNNFCEKAKEKLSSYDKILPANPQEKT